MTHAPPPTDSPSYTNLMSYSLRLLGRRSYTVHGLSEKLRQRSRKSLTDGEAKDEIEAVVARLMELHYLDDQRYCERWVEERSRLKPRGRYALTRELRAKGVPKEQIEKFWGSEQGTAFDDRAQAERLLEKRLRFHAGEISFEARQKHYRYLASKGFSPDVISEALDKAMKQS